MTKTWMLFLAATLALPAATQPASAKSRPIPVPSATGTLIHGEVPESRGAALLYLFQIPDDTVQVDVAVQSADGGVALRAVCGAAAPKDDEWSWEAAAEDDRAKLSLTRHTESDLRAGPFLVEVRPADAAGHHGGEPGLPFTLRVDVTRIQAPSEIAPGREIDSETAPELGHRRDFAFDVPAGASALRIDLVEAARDLDLLLSANAPPLDRDTAQWKAASPLGRESLVLDASAQPPLPAGGRLYVSVVDPSLYDAPVQFRLLVTLGATLPASALVLPELPRPSDPRERALAAVVEIIAGDHSGSGTLVREDGLILTARHVIGDRTGEQGDIVIAMNLDPTGMTRDLFHASVVAADAGLDLALLQITSGLYAQPIPNDYRFPACPVAFDGLPRLGAELVTIGFPEPGGLGTRSPVMYSRGVVSGFEREKSGLRIKTDAFLASGSSGGAVLDARFRLVGVPVFTVSDSYETAILGFFVPVMELPDAWQERISARK